MLDHRSRRILDQQVAGVRAATTAFNHYLIEKMSVKRTYLILETFPVDLRGDLNVIPSYSLHGLFGGESKSFIGGGESGSPVESLRHLVFGDQGRQVPGHAHVMSGRSIFKV